MSSQVNFGTKYNEPFFNAVGVYTKKMVTFEMCLKGSVVVEELEGGGGGEEGRRGEIRDRGEKKRERIKILNRKGERKRERKRKTIRKRER